MPHNQHTIWTEKYRPDSLENYIGNTGMKATVAAFIQNNDIPHLLFTGKAGTGKTTIAKIIINALTCDVLELNASRDNNIETVRTKIHGFVCTMGFSGGLKIVVLDEFDGFSRQGQESLRNTMEEFAETARFIFTGNYVQRIIDPIISRCQQFEVVPPSKRDAAMHVAGILQKEGVTFVPTDLKLLIDAHFPDIRKVINECQLRSLSGHLAIDATAIVENDFKLKVVDILKGDGNGRTKFQRIRQIVADSGLRDFSDVYRVLFDRVDDYATAHVSTVILALAEGQYKDGLVVDKEINLMATLINVLQVIG